MKSFVIVVLKSKASFPPACKDQWENTVLLSLGITGISSDGIAPPAGIFLVDKISSTYPKVPSSFSYFFLSIKFIIKTSGYLPLRYMTSAELSSTLTALSKSNFSPNLSSSALSLLP